MHVVESHHDVLPIWATYRRGVSRAPYLITLDHHTDTSSPFRNYLKKLTADPERQAQEQQKLLKQIDFRNPASVLEATKLLSHDEHILTALQTGIIGGAFVVAQNARDTELSVYQQYRVCCYSVARENPSSLATIDECDRVLESSFLQSALNHFEKILAQDSVSGPLFENAYIFDIDLDYFNTKKSIAPIDRAVLLHLANRAGLITIATESDHVLKCAREDHVRSEDLLQSLTHILSARE